MPRTSATFGELLKRHRVAADISQDELAERAHLSTTAVSALERGVRRAPYRDTVRLLADALDLSEDARHDFFGAADRARARGARGTDGNAPPAPRLPSHLTSFVGRAKEIADIGELLGTSRLVTVTGAGGIGKTRTSLEVGARLLEEWGDAVWFADLAPIDRDALIASRLASVFGIAFADGDAPLAALVDALERRRLLLILDNCEQVVAGAAAVAAAVLRGCPNVTILATSRERLGIGGEAVYRLPTLPVPDADVALSAAEARSYAALELFAARALTAEPRFALTDGRVQAVAEICRRLEGIALAIELAAARLPLLGLETLRARLDERFSVLVGGGRDVPARQQTLLATIAWSYDLLDEHERAILRRLAIFAGGWTIEAAEFVCAVDDEERLVVFGVLSSLVEKSLVAIDTEGDSTRYRLFESTRAYALEKLSGADEHAMLARRHAEWLATFADGAQVRYLTTPRHTWTRDVAPELDNARVALEWALGPTGDAVLAGRIAAGLYGAWWTIGLREEGMRWVETTLERLDEARHPGVAAALLLSRAGFARGNARVEASQRAIALCERVGGLGLALGYKHLCLGLAQTGRFAEAEAAIDRAVRLYRDAGMQQSLIFVGALADRGAILLHRGRVAEARATLGEALDLGEALGDDWRAAHVRNMLAGLEFDEGDAQFGIDLAHEAVESARRLGSVRDETFGLCHIACFLLTRGDLAGAEAAARSALALARRREAFLVHVSIQHLGAVAALRGKSARAARLLGYIDAWYRREGCVPDLVERKSYEILAAAVRGQLAADELAELLARGADFTEERAVAEALEAS